MNESTFRRRFHACLDARQDPFDDADVVAFLDAHPEQVPTWAQLRHDAIALAALPQPVAPDARGRRGLVLATGATAAATILAALWPHVGPAPSPGSRIVAASFVELRPRAHAAATIVVREPLLHTVTTRLENYEQWSERR